MWTMVVVLMMLLVLMLDEDDVDDVVVVVVVLLLAQPVLVVAQPVLVVAPPEVAPPEVLAEAEDGCNPQDQSKAPSEVQLLVMGKAVLGSMSMVGQKQQQATAVHLWELWEGSGPASSS